MMEKDLADILTAEERGELLVLVSNITEGMRNQLEMVLSLEAQKSILSTHMMRNPNLPLSPELATGTTDTSLDETQVQLQQAKDVRESEYVQLSQLKPVALSSFDSWQEAFFHKIVEILARDTVFHEHGRSKVKGSRHQSPPLKKLKHWFPRIDTSLASTLSVDKSPLITHAFLLISLSLGSYDARSRTVLLQVCNSLNIPVSTLLKQEAATAHILVASVQSQSAASTRSQLALPESNELSAEPQVQKRIEAGQTSRRWKIGLASVAGAVVVGLTGGLAAPLLASGLGALLGGIGLGGSVAAGYLGAMAASAPLVGGLFGAYGGKMSGEMMSRYAKEVEDFAFIPLKPRLESRLRVVICISGWLTDEDQVLASWTNFNDFTSVYALRWEMKALLELGSALDTFVRQYAISYIQSEIIKRTVLASLWSALWPLGLLKFARIVDNPFSVAKSRSDKAGLVLADVIVQRAQGNRPVTLVGYSLGARVIYRCLMSLAQRHAFGLVENAVLMGSPVPSTTESWAMMKSVVGGRLINVYSNEDWVLGFLYRTSAIQLGVAGLQVVRGVAGVENFDAGGIVDGHLKYSQSVQQILAQVLDSELTQDIYLPY